MSSKLLPMDISEKEIKYAISEYKPATFEEAVTATKFGKFNITLGLLSMLASLCAIFDSSSMSYTVVAAQCDLELSLNNKGLLNSFIYIGMVSSAVAWGFLFDVLGRKRLLIIGFLIDAIFVFISAFSQNLTMLLISKVLQGFIINGPFAALSSYMSEFHCAKYRPTFQLLIGCCVSIGTVVLPLIAWIILPYNMDFTFFNLNFHSWNVFLLVTGLPALLSGLVFLLFPESPKFLMTCGENEKALAIFRKVYSINTGQPEDTFPIKQLIEETKLNANKHGGQVTAQRTKGQALREGFQQIKPLFFAPHLSKISLTCSLIFFNLMSLQMMRLWLPQIFQIITDYLLAHNGTSASLCVMLETISSPNRTTEECTVNRDNSIVYINSAIVGFSGVVGCGFVGFIIHFIAKKKILLVAELIGVGSCISIYFAKSPSIVLACSSLFVASSTVCSNIIISMKIDLFPTILRTLAIALGLMIGRIGAMIGNFMFPFLLKSGCEAPFFVVAGFIAEQNAATFEEAITATGFGKFNIVLALIAMLASSCSMFDSTSMSYTFVAAQCDLELSLQDKGLLNSLTYAGMVSSAMIWGFLFDVLGRKKLLSIGLLIDAVFIFLSSLSQNVTMLLVSKYLQGFIINGPFAALNAYMSEYHSVKYRSGFQMLIGSCMSAATVALPLIAWAILPQNLDFTLVKLNFHSWNVFLLITGLPALSCGLIFIFLPESPKFLMTCGENEKALAVFRKIYSINTGKPANTFPIQKLVDETKLSEGNKYGGQVTAQRTKRQAFKEGFQQIKPLFFAPNRSRIMLTCSIIFFSLMGLQMIRLWLPQIFQTMTDYIQAHNGTSESLCTMLETISSPIISTEECTVNTDNSTVYTNSAIVGTVGFIACTCLVFIIRVVGKKKLLMSTQLIGVGCCISIYFAKNTAIVLLCSSLFVASTTASTNLMTSVTVDLFPTTLRTLAIALGLMMGRVGAMIGNFIFPYLLASGCAPPFFVVAGFMSVAIALSIFLPNTHMQGLS